MKDNMDIIHRYSFALFRIYRDLRKAKSSGGMSGMPMVIFVGDKLEGFGQSSPSSHFTCHVAQKRSELDDYIIALSSKSQNLSYRDPLGLAPTLNNKIATLVGSGQQLTQVEPRFVADTTYK